MQPNQTPVFNNLPLQWSSFIGREHELAQLRQLIWSTRLLTLTGPGGCGKTRLAVRLAEQLFDAFRDGAWFIDLAALPATGSVAQSTAAVFALHESAERGYLAALVDYLRPKELLLILDNCEHILAGCAELAARLLRACPNLYILTTSREALNVDGEISWPTPALSVVEPAPGLDAARLERSEAARLFLARAAAVLPDFGATDLNAPVIAQICYQLDGLPLAIELAAVRIRALPVEDVAARLSNRFSLLNLGRRTAPARHQTLRAMIDWSYGLLSAYEKKLFRRLAVFAGGWTIDAALAVCSDAGSMSPGVGERQETLDGLARLVEKSLVTLNRTPAGTRYQFLETIHAYARDKLLTENQTWTEEGQVARDQHLAYFCAWSEAAEAGLDRANQLAWLARYDAELENIRAALEWSLEAERRALLGLRLAVSLGWYWEMRGFLREGRAQISALLVKTGAGAPPELRAKALYIAAGLAFVQTDYPATRAMVEESISLYRASGPAGRAGLANALIRLGDTRRAQGEYQAAAPLLQEGLRLMRELDDRYGIVHALWQLGYHSLSSGAEAQAEAYFLEALPLSRRLVDQSVTAVILSGLSELALRQGNLARAADYEAESMALRKEIGEKWGIAVSLGNFAWIAILHGETGKAQTLLLESLSLRREIQDLGGIAWCLEKLAKSDLLSGQAQAGRPVAGLYQRAARLLGAAASLRAPAGSVIDQADQLEYERDRGILHKALGEHGFAEHWQAGAGAPLEDLLDDILADSTKTAAQNAKENAAGLTARERAVAALIAEGKTNREIAQALTVEVKTVETHITHIFNKLGFDTRVQIAVWAVEKGLARPAAAY